MPSASLARRGLVTAFACLFAVVTATAGAARAQPTCPAPTNNARLAELVRASEFIVVGTITAQDNLGPDRSEVAVRPEAFLKGNPTAGLIRFAAGLPGPCSSPEVGFATGARVLLLSDGGRSWPEAERAYRLENGTARSDLRGDTAVEPEAALVDRIRSITGQYTVPATTAGEGSGIDWWKTVVPVGGAVVALLVVSLFLMRIWHRIDPS